MIAANVSSRSNKMLKSVLAIRHLPLVCGYAVPQAHRPRAPLDSCLSLTQRATDSGPRGALQHEPLVFRDPRPKDNWSPVLPRKCCRVAALSGVSMPALHMAGKRTQFSTSVSQEFQLRAGMEVATDSLPTAVTSAITAQLPVVITLGTSLRDAIPAAYALLGRQPDATEAMELVRARTCTEIAATVLPHCLR